MDVLHFILEYAYSAFLRAITFNLIGNKVRKAFACNSKQITASKGMVYKE